MSSDPLIHAMENQSDDGPKTWKDIDVQRWQAKADQCPARNVPVSTSFCILTTGTCEYETFFGRYWGII